MGGESFVPQLENAPLIYVLGVLRFPGLVEPKKLAEGLQSRLRDRFPHFEMLEANQLDIEVGPEGAQIRHMPVSTWHFASSDKKWGVMVNAGQIAVHTIDYADHLDFIDRFVACVDAARDVPEIGIRHVEGIGLRYVDLVVPREGEILEDYLVESFLPTDIKEAQLGILDGVHAARFGTAEGVLRVQISRSPPTLLPLELTTEFTQKNGWAPPRPERDFAVLDYDHGNIYETLVDASSFDVRQTMIALHAPIRRAFDALARPFGMQVWKGEA